MTTMHDRSNAAADRVGRVLRVLALAAFAPLCGCATDGGPARVQASEAAAYTVRLPPTQVYFYPAAGQDADRQERDRYECYLWAVQQTGFDPSLPHPAPYPRVEVIPMPPPGRDTALGAVTGAMLGAAVAHPRDAAEGAVLGAVAGAVIGAASDAARQGQAERIQQRYEQRDLQHVARIERLARDYRRAMAACLEGRGYIVH